MPDLRDVYRTRDFEPDYSDSQDDFVRNSDGETRVDPRYLRTRAEKSHRYNEEFDGTNALRLKSSGEKLVFNLSALVILLSVCILR